MYFLSITGKIHLHNFSSTMYKRELDAKFLHCVMTCVQCLHTIKSLVFYHPFYLDIMHARLCTRLSLLFNTASNKQLQGLWNEAATKVRAAKQLACSVVTGDNVGKFVLRHAQVTNLGGELTSELPGYPSRQHVWRNRYEFL